MSETAPSIVEQLRDNPQAGAALTGERRRTEKGEPVSHLEHHLRQYLRRNNSDFFIHKDLAGFLNRELDFYLKNEVLNLDNLTVAGEDMAEGWFQQMRLTKAVGGKIIDFLAQIQNFQKMLWEKRKFVTETQYCITLSNISPEFYPDILIWGANAKDKADPIRIEKAFPAIISKAKSQRVNRLMRSRAPKIAHPRRVGSTYLLSGLVKCHRCNRALSGQDAKSGQFSYYVCQSIMKRGKDACDTPRLNAHRFEEMVVGKIRANVLTEGNIRALVKVVDEQMDGVAREQRKRLEAIEDELEDVKRKLGRIWHFVETTDINMADASDRIKEHRERQERLEDAAADARAILSQRRAVLDDVNTIAAYAQDMSEFLKDSELTERRAFIETFVKEIVVMLSDALLRYTIPISQSTTKTEVLMVSRFGCDSIGSGGSTDGRATLTLMAGSILHRWSPWCSTRLASPSWAAPVMSSGS